MRSTRLSLIIQPAWRTLLERHLPAMANSKTVNPVILPSGRAKLVTKPAATGLETCVKTIGMASVYCRSATAGVLVAARITSGCRSTSSFAKDAAPRAGSADGIGKDFQPAVEGGPPVGRWRYCRLARPPLASAHAVWCALRRKWQFPAE